jgi:proteic killer suppression protein
VIRSFRSKATERFAQGQRVATFEAVRQTAERRLQALDAAPSLNALGAIPGHRLEALKGNRKGQHSIRINDQWRVCFRWLPDGAHDVEIVDYHH